MKNQSLIPVLIIFALGFVCGAFMPSCDSNKSEFNPVDSSVSVNQYTVLHDTVVTITHEPIKTQLKFKSVVIRRSQTGNEETNRDTISVPAASDSVSTTVFVCDTMLKQGELKLTSQTPIPLGLWFDFKPFADTVHLQNKETFTTKEIRIEVERKRPWYEVPGYVGIGVVVGAVVGILARGK